MAQIARVDLSKYFPDGIETKYQDAASIASAGLSSLHLTALYGGRHLDSVSDSSESSMTAWDSDKNFPLHLAAASGRLFAFPLENLPVDLLHYINSDGCSVFDLAHHYGNAEQLPPGLKSRNLCQEHIPTPESESVIEAARIGKLEKKMRKMIKKGLRADAQFPFPAMLPGLFFNAISNDYNNSTLLHLAAENNSFQDIPKELLTENSLLLRDRRGQTPLHRITSLAALDGLPSEIVTRNVLTARDHRGTSVADLLVEEDTESILPDNIRLLAKDPVIARIKELFAQSPNAAKDFWDLHGREHLSEQKLHEFFREQRLLKGTGCSSSPPEPIVYQTLANMNHAISEASWILMPNGTVCEITSVGKSSIIFQYRTSKNTMRVKPLWNYSVHDFTQLGTFKRRGVLGYRFAADTLDKLQESFESLPDATKNMLHALKIERVAKTHAEQERQRELLEARARKEADAARALRIKAQASDDLIRHFELDFVGSRKVWEEHLHEHLGEDEFQQSRTAFVRNWFKRYPDLALDEEQAEAVAEYGSHIQVTARAGSGKTRTLVARVLFQITHCRIPARSILVLAFNKEAVKEIRDRLGKHLAEDQMPHVLTFHALAHRIVKPQEDLIYDEGDTKEGQIFSTSIQSLIDEELRNGPFEAKLRELMEARWNADLKRIIEFGFNLPQEEFLEHRASLSRTTMNGRRVDTEAHKHIGNALLRLRVRYRYRRGTHRYSGETYAPDFSHFHKETDRRFLIEVLGEDTAPPNAARQAFWNSDRSANALLLQLAVADCQNPDVTLERVARELTNCGLSVSPMSDEFQDFSHLFDELRKSIIAQSPDANFFCVGDDWQAINKFAGSDLRYFTGFTETFEPSVRKLITRNYRSCRKIVEIGNRVMQGAGELSVPNSNEQGNTWRVEVGGFLNLTEAEEVVVDELGDDALAILRIASDCTSRGESVAILSRTNSVATPEGMHKLERWREKLRSFLQENNRELLEVSTTHGYKGKEADVVILLDPEAYPFIHPDSIFNTIFGDTFDSIQEDEMRLFYVGVTRPKKTLYLLSYPSRYSEMRPYRIQFLADAYPTSFDINRLHSNLLCGGRVVVRLANRPGTFGSNGTYPLKDQLKATGYRWNEDNKTWSIFLEEGSINSPFECRQFLMRQPWISDADGVVASFAWEDQQHRMTIIRGSVFPDGTPAQVAKQDRLENAKPAFVTKESDENITPPAHRPSALNSAVHPPTPEATPTGVFETNVVGMRHGGGMEKAKHLSTGDFVKLEREPQNTHDRNAIQVMTSEGARIGYVSAKVAAHLARGLDAWGGTSQAKVTSVWKQPPPNFLVSVQICFPLPPNVAIPRELDANAQLEDNPFAVARPPVRATPHPIKSVEAETVGDESGEITPRQTSAELLEEPQSPGEPLPSFSGSLTKAQEEALEGLLDPSLGSIITTLYLSGCCLWPEIPYEALDPRGICTGSMLEVAWPDSKIGIALASNDVDSFVTSGWTILPAATVSVTELRDLLSAADGLAAPSGMTHPRKALSPTSTKIPADNPGTTENHHLYRKGPFMDDDADDDIPF